MRNPFVSLAEHRLGKAPRLLSFLFRSFLLTKVLQDPLSFFLFLNLSENPWFVIPSPDQIRVPIAWPTTGENHQHHHRVLHFTLPAIPLFQSTRQYQFSYLMGHLCVGDPLT